MHRALVASAAALALAPATASAATTFTVDAAAGDAACTGNVCRTIGAALAKAGDGDTVHVKAGTYAEDPLTVTHAVRIEGEQGTNVTTASGVADKAVFTVTHDGVTIAGISATNATGGGRVVLSKASDLVLDGVVLARTAGPADTPVVEIDGTPTSGTTTIAHAIVVNAIAATGNSAPAIQGGPANSLALSDSFVVAGSGQGPALTLTGAGADANRIVRSTVEALSPSSDAVKALTGTAGDKQLAIDSSILSGGANAASLTAASSGGSGVGNLAVAIVHGTLAGAAKAVAVSAQANGITAAAGNVAVTADRSILRGPSTVAACGAAQGCVLSANTATLAITGGDTDTAPASGITVGSSTNTPGAALFVDEAVKDLHLRADAPVIDRGGAVGAGESDKDVDGQPRVAGAASDIGADEFVNRAPAAALTGPGSARQFRQASFDASASKDPEAGAGGGIATYHFDFGDGTSTDSASPKVTHAYDKTGAYTATVTVTDAQGLAGTAPATVGVTVVDGVAPTARIVSPKRHRTLRLHTKRGRIATIRFSGTAADDKALAGVGLSLRRITKSRTTCRFFDGKRSFRKAPCSSPAVFLVNQRQGLWTYKVKRGVRLRRGRYELTATAVDAAGNVSATAKRRFTLK